MTARLVGGGALIGVMALTYLAATQPEPARAILVSVGVLAALVLVIACAPKLAAAPTSVAAVEHAQELAPQPDVRSKPGVAEVLASLPFGVMIIGEDGKIR